MANTRIERSDDEWDRLIEAAPLMLDALKTIVRYLREPGIPSQGTLVTLEGIATIAIAKAEGGSQ